MLHRLTESFHAGVAAVAGEKGLNASLYETSAVAAHGTASGECDAEEGSFTGEVECTALYCT